LALGLLVESPVINVIHNPSCDKSVCVCVFVHVSFWLSFYVHDALQINAVGLVDKTCLCLSISDWLPLCLSVSLFLTNRHTHALSMSETEGRCLSTTLLNQSMTCMQVPPNNIE